MGVLSLAAGIKKRSQGERLLSSGHCKPVRRAACHLQREGAAQRSWSPPSALHLHVLDVDIHLVESDLDAVLAEQLVDLAVQLIDGRVAIAQLFDIQKRIS